MNYNFIRKTKDREFSLKKDLEQTAEDASNLMCKISPIYRKVGLEKLVKKSEKILGELDAENRAQVETGYAFGTIYLGLGIMLGNLIFYVFSGGFYGFSLLYHSTTKKIK